MIRALWLSVFLVGYASADDQIGDILRQVEPPLLKVLRGDKPAPILDAKAGKADAESDLKKGLLVITRYDLPLATTNGSDWDAPYERFGISERGGMGPKVYCDAYNKVMDDALARRFGDAYRKERGKLLPPADAQPYQITREAEQAGAGPSTTRPESKSDGGDKPQPEAEGRSR